MSMHRIANILPKYNEYFYDQSLDRCVHRMADAKKHGKILYEFFKQAVQTDMWKEDVTFKKLLLCCASNKRLVSGKYKDKFKKIKHVFKREVLLEDLKKRPPAPEEPPCEPPKIASNYSDNGNFPDYS